MAARTALIIPTLNEAESIAAVVAEVPRSVIDQVIVADGGSSDETCARAALAGAKIVHAGRGYGRACLAGALAAADAEILVFMDGDGADNPAVIGAMILPIAADAVDFVIGSRTRGNAAPHSLGRHQRWVGVGLGLAMNVLYGVRYTDMCALRAIRRELLLSLGMQEMTYGWNLEMQMRVARRGKRVLELPVDNRERIGGTSKVAGTFSGSLRVGARILATFGRLLISSQAAETRHSRGVGS
ncbi:MAG: glycosyltransferase family 2 protein [Steroidobacteraceae bacterium]